MFAGRLSGPVCEDAGPLRDKARRHPGALTQDPSRQHTPGDARALCYNGADGRGGAGHTGPEERLLSPLGLWPCCLLACILRVSVVLPMSCEDTIPAFPFLDASKPRAE